MKKQSKLLAVLLTVMAIGFTGCKTEVTVPAKKSGTPGNTLKFEFSEEGEITENRPVSTAK